jgi:hypothetical protein
VLIRVTYLQELKSVECVALFLLSQKRNGGIEMKGFLSHEEVEKIKEKYSAGTRIELIHMDDPYAPIEPGMQGIVEMVDDAGTLHMKWDNGRTLGIVPGEDHFKVIHESAEEVMDNEQTMGGMKI